MQQADLPPSLQCPLPLGETAYRRLLHMQSVMQPVEDEARRQSHLSAAQEREHFAAAMRTTMETQAALDQEEDQLVDEGRRVGMSWPDIAAMLPTRQLSELKRRHSSHAAAQARTNHRLEMAQLQALHPLPSSGISNDGQGPWFHIPRRPARDAAQPRKLVGQERIMLLRPRTQPPEGFTGLAWHKQRDTTGWRFYDAADVVDPDQEDGGEVYHFNLSDEAHGACFNLGEDAEGNTLISWSALHALYTLPDGSIWAEHSDFVDHSDLEELARKEGKDASEVLEGADEERELFRRAGRRHSRLQDVEYQCWVFRDALPDSLPDDVTSASDAFFCRKSFDPTTLKPLEE